MSLSKMTPLSLLTAMKQAVVKGEDWIIHLCKHRLVGCKERLRKQKTEDKDGALNSFLLQ